MAKQKLLNKFFFKKINVFKKKGEKKKGLIYESMILPP